MSRHLCPGWGLNDCPKQTKVIDARGDRCPECDTKNRDWERVTDFRYIQYEGQRNSYNVYDAMMRASYG